METYLVIEINLFLKRKKIKYCRDRSSDSRYLFHGYKDFYFFYGVNSCLCFVVVVCFVLLLFVFVVVCACQLLCSLEAWTNPKRWFTTSKARLGVSVKPGLNQYRSG